MKTLNVAAVIGAIALVVTFILDRSSCLGLPQWAIPLLTTVQLGLMWLAKSPLAVKEG